MKWFWILNHRLIYPEGAIGGSNASLDSGDICVLTDLMGQLDPNATLMRLAHPGFATIPDPPQSVRPKTRSCDIPKVKEMKRVHEMTTRSHLPMLAQIDPPTPYHREVKMCPRPSNALTARFVNLDSVFINPEMNLIERSRWREWGSLPSHPLRLPGCLPDETYLPLSAWPLMIVKPSGIKLECP